MFLFPDTSAVFKLAAFDLLKETFAILHGMPAEVFVLEETRRMCRGTDMQREYGRLAVARADAFVRAAGRLAHPIDPTEQDILSDVEGIEAGEAVLFAATKGYEDFYLITDDKNSLRALAEEPDCVDVFARLEGKVICLEQLLLWAISHLGYEQARPKLLLAHHCIAVLHDLYRGNPQAVQSQVEAALRDAVERLRLECNYLLVPPHI